MKYAERVVAGCDALSAGQKTAPRFDPGGVKCVTFRPDLNHQGVQAAARCGVDDLADLRFLGFRRKADSVTES